MNGLALTGILLVGPGLVPAQAPVRPNAAEILLALKKLRVLASVLYVGAHPDDENTRLIAYLCQGRLADTGYLSMTRGDGGQNLVGPEMRELLGIIRTQELLAARRIDGGRQFFTRAIDFGYSKHPDETFNIWDREKVLADTIRIFNEFEPDVVITRFPTKAGTTHGHHTASALLALEAAGIDKPEPDPSGEAAWRPTRILWNTSPFFYDDRDSFDPTGLLTLDVGGFSPLLGESYTEVAARSRSMHKSQGFGSSGQRGEVLEYLEHLGGERAQKDLFEGIDTSWRRVPGGEPVGAALEKAYHNFDPEDPAGVVPTLLEARRKLQALADGRWKRVKLMELERVIADCLGLFLEITAEDYSVVPGQSVTLKIEAVPRNAGGMRLSRISFPEAGKNLSVEKDLERQKVLTEKIDLVLPPDIPLSQPYWLREAGSKGIFRVEEPALIGLAENPPALNGIFEFVVEGEPVSFTKPVVYKWNDPVAGERYRPFEILPEVSVNLEEKVFVFAGDETRSVRVSIRSGKAGIKGVLRMELPEGWKADPTTHSFELATKAEETTLEFRVQPPSGASVGTLGAIAEVEGRQYRRGLLRIEYGHIPPQVYLPVAEARLVRIDLQRKGERIGYLQGAGDQMPQGLRQIGYEVQELEPSEITREGLRRFDAVILGVRAYNTVDRIQFFQPMLFDYVKEGGTLIVQFTTSYGMKVKEVAPYPLKISRDRVAVEEADVRFLIPDHPVLNQPNRITQADFDGWVQERGLYFANEWDEHFQALLSSNDPGEPARDGGLLVAKYGDGYFVYTGYSWFRQFPAGVPGAYRLFVNLISIGK